MLVITSMMLRFTNDVLDPPNLHILSDHVNNVLVREAIKEILGNFEHRQKMGGGQWYSQTFYQSEVGKYV